MIQGYGLTETAPIVTLNHPFGTSKGSVGKPIAGVEVKIAADGEILVRGDNVTTGYFNARRRDRRARSRTAGSTPATSARSTPDGRLFIRGRKKEMIVTPEGLNVFPEDVERVLNAIPGVRDSAAVGVHDRTARSACTWCWCSIRASTPTTSCARRTRSSRIISGSDARCVWPERELPRTEGTQKLKRAAIREWLQTGGARRGVAARTAPTRGGADRAVRRRPSALGRRPRSRSWG